MAGKNIPKTALGQPPVVIQRRGMGTTLVGGFFATICVTVVCVSAVLIYGMSLVDRRMQEIVKAGPEILNQVRDWQEVLPPAVTDAFDDRRAPEYRDRISVDVRMVADRYSTHMSRPVVEVSNLGDQMVTMLTLRLVVMDETGTPVREFSTYAATPVAVESDWRGPLMPQATRKITLQPVYGLDLAAEVTVEVVDLRVWNGAQPPVMEPEADNELTFQQLIEEMTQTRL